jgi:tetratricopeptide (TPR) repeat protein
MYSTAATFLYMARRYDEAVETARRGAALDPTDFDTRWWWTVAALRVGRADEAMESLAELLDADGSGGGEALVAAYRMDGPEAVWRWFLESGRAQERPGAMAAGYAMLGESDEALTWLEHAYDARDSWMFFLNDPVFDSIRQDPRFVDLLRRLDLPLVRSPPA